MTADCRKHILLSFYWAERKLVWEVLHLGVVRKMEADFEDVTGTALHPAASAEESERLVLELARQIGEPPGMGDAAWAGGASLCGAAAARAAGTSVNRRERGVRGAAGVFRVTWTPPPPPAVTGSCLRPVS
jgi:hypothetical protein